MDSIIQTVSILAKKRELLPAKVHCEQKSLQYLCITLCLLIMAKKSSAALEPSVLCFNKAQQTIVSLHECLIADEYLELMFCQADMC